MSLLLKSLIFFYIIVLIMVITGVKARPGGEWANPANGCTDTDTRKIEICQRCAKQTKSPIVYPMCCNEEDEVHNWCYRYTNYGKEA